MVNIPGGYIALKDSKGIAEKGVKIRVNEWDTFTEDRHYVVCTVAPTSTE